MADCVPLLHICLAASMPLRTGIARVHYDDVRVVLLRQRDRFAAIGSLRNHVKPFVAFEQHAEPFPDNRVVIRQQDSD
jgi:hypothetical protein